MRWNSVTVPARTTRDIDLTCAAVGDMQLQTRLRDVREQLQAAAELDLGDYLAFRIEEAQTELAGAPLGGARFPCEAFLAGKTYGRFHIDLGFGDETGDVPETLTGDDLLAFVGVPPAQVLAIPTPQQFAEKIHAYTRPWTDRVNMRTRDLVDLVLLIETSSVEPPDIAIAVKVIRPAQHSPCPARSTRSPGCLGRRILYPRRGSTPARIDSICCHPHAACFLATGRWMTPRYSSRAYDSRFEVVVRAANLHGPSASAN
ncbi:MAG: nucleotidyl transferase AbiEii/AbiGii toxin family protein [Planctomycetota bacterium]|nr:nucleotidyl transferase AbiEii/AbiGii toxin family protein [Planctomycetota bacterium]